ncbi:MAG: MBL fold metallo-hydrolase [Anaerolineae bacterium]|nr:MBL fold metallo-hydrolase [Anaerolineae bacterium]
MILEQTVVGPLQVNCFVVGDEATREAVVIDPGDAPRQILALLNNHGLRLTTILCTHAHFDHVMGIREVQKATGARFLLHLADLPVLHSVPGQIRLWLGQETEKPPEPDGFLSEGDVVRAGSMALRVLHVPGHSPGSVAFVDDKDKVVFAGDALFAGSIGRTDIPGGDYDTLMDSIHDKLLPLPDAYRVFPGHGSPTTIGQERQANPFLVPGARLL